jgi:hypothetical protein
MDATRYSVTSGVEAVGRLTDRDLARAGSW